MVGLGTMGPAGRRVGPLVLDPRAVMGLLVAATVVSFAPKSLVAEFGLVACLGMLQAASGRVRMAVGWVVAYAVLMVVLTRLLPAVGGIAATMFTISLTYARKIYLCLMAGALLASTCSVHRITTALARLGVPRSVLIPLTVSMRYFPTLADEASHIRDAMRLRDIPVSERLECFVVPLVMSATNTADELSRAATCRGIENPVRPTDTERLRMRGMDWAVLAVAACVVAGVFVWGGAL